MQALETIDEQEIERLRAAQEYFWLDLHDPTPEQLAELAKLFNIHPVAVEDLEDFGQRPKIDDYEDFLHIVYFGVEDSEPVEIHILVHGDSLVTVRRDGCRPLTDLHSRIEPLDPSREEYALYKVLDTLTDSFFPLLEELDDAIEEAEDRVVERGGKAFDLEAVIALRRRLSRLRRIVFPMRDMLAGAGDFVDRVPGLRADEAHDYYRDVYDHLLRIGDSIESYRDVLTSLHDIYLSAQSNRLNEVVYRLTVVGTIFLPITFITGFFGQNFGWLVDGIKSEAAFFGLGIGLEVLAVVALLVWFRRAGVRE